MRLVYVKNILILNFCLLFFVRKQRKQSNVVRF